MKYIVLIEIEEYGPISADVLIKWVENGRVLPETQVRSSMLNNWHKAIEYDFLADSFMKQKSGVDQGKQSKGANSAGYSKNELRIAAKDKNIKKEECLTTYNNPFLPNPAPISLRVFATLFDYILIGTVVFCFFIIASFVRTSFDGNINLVFYLFFFASFIFLLIYFAICFGIFAQTFGMWFWGILLVCNGDDARPVYLGRAFLSTVLMLFFGIFSPFFVYVSGGNRALHDILSGTQVVRISARPK